MSRLLKWLLIFIVSSLTLCLLVWQHWRVKDVVYTYWYTHQTETVTSQKQIDEILGRFEKLPFNKLPSTYQDITLSNKAPFHAMLEGKSYIVLTGKDIYNKIVGDFPIKDFLPKDQAYKKHLRSLGDDSGLFWLIDKKLLYKFLALQQQLEKAGHDPSAFHVTNGYRHPAYNKAVGGASKSRHILGQAVDISVRDINKDGKVNHADKKIVLDVLDQQVIGAMGGIGRYPKTLSVHFDVRGYHARWDSY